MEKYENEVFGFGNETENENENDNMIGDTSNKFNYNSISGLGESDYENEDLFNIESTANNNELNKFNNFMDKEDDDSDDSNESTTFSNKLGLADDDKIHLDSIITKGQDDSKLGEESEDYFDDNNIDEDTDISVEETDEENVDEQVIENVDEEEDDIDIPISDTPIEEIKGLTKFKDEKIEMTDITALFDKVSTNVKDASEIFKRNTEMKQKIDSRFEELKELQAELETTKKEQMDEINNYKKEVFNKLNAKKIEIEKRLNVLKDLQASLEKEKDDFEQYRKAEQEKIDTVQKDIQTAYDDRREELNKVEDELRKQKDALDEERNQLSLDRIQYESDKNDLANNILKFNELVDSFSNSVSEVKGE